MRNVYLVLVCSLFLAIGCKSVYYDTPSDGFPADYKSQIYLETVGTGEVDFEYLGFGEGQSVGSGSKNYDKLAAYKQATGGDPNVILASSNSQVVIEKSSLGFLELSRTETYTIWGYKFKIKGITSTKGQKSQLHPPARTGKPPKPVMKGMFGMF